MADRRGASIIGEGWGPGGGAGPMRGTLDYDLIKNYYLSGNNCKKTSNDIVEKCEYCQ